MQGKASGSKGRHEGWTRGVRTEVGSWGSRQTATECQWRAIVLDLFDRMDKDKNKKLSEDEINQALQSHGLKGDNASAVAVLHEFFHPCVCPRKARNDMKRAR
jgi:hypothetical protein